MTTINVDQTDKSSDWIRAATPEKYGKKYVESNNSKGIFIQD